ncbi:cell division protein CrgA [Bifidobacterium saguinibicoloris]|uniref:cell division protein CrgA n=1 Tax=Bifidobacterium saguinibicoloris TaxID=2834433 RepID=UPI001C566016|nr:cell division protein CrgA [Bifidobacterium saguinibicoloris]MBW3081480.1 cell division protein CrgA [Bifidobacterium saguinibicoloris]
MADEELHENDSKDQKDWQAETAATATDAKDDAKGTDAEDVAADDATEETSEETPEDYGVDMDQVEAVLNATADKKSMSPQMRRMMARQEENTKRVEETIKGTKSNPRWFVPLFCALMVIGLVWVVCYYLTGNYPIPGIDAWNLLIGFVIILIGFLMTMWWR